MAGPRRNRIAWSWALALGLASVGLTIVCASLLQQRDELQQRVRGLEDQLMAYRQLQLEQARWQEEWRVEKRELVRAQREALIRQQQAEAAADQAPDSGEVSGSP